MVQDIPCKSMALLDQQTIEGFVKEARSRGLGQVVLAWRQEYAQVPPDATQPLQVVYDRITQCVLLAYDGGTILRCTLVGADAGRDNVRRRLESEGFAVSERSRNIT
jgi:hypothetical protein